MRNGTIRKVSALCMLLLLTAQVMGWCRAYVCDCGGEISITAASHCHEDESHEHPTGDSHFPHCCGDALHSHAALSTDLAVPRMVSASDLPTATLAAVLPPPFEKTLHERKVRALFTEVFWTSNKPPGLHSGARHRHTLAMLI